jgi:formylglycine-generating enzyme
MICRRRLKTVLGRKRGQAPLPEDVFGREKSTGATEPVHVCCCFEMRSKHGIHWVFSLGVVLMVALSSRGADTVTNSIEMKLALVPAGEFMMGAEESRADTLAYFPYCSTKWLDGEWPRHKVRITKPFYMGQYPVTIGEFLVFYHFAHYQLEIERDGKASQGFDSSGKKMIQSAKYRPWAPGWDVGMDHPAVYVSWNDAVAFCEWLSKREGKKYRLPTEAEWEYACRAGTNTRFFFGNDPEDLVFYANAADADRAESPGNAPIALYDRQGNKTNAQIPFPFLKRRDGYSWTSPVGKFRPNAFGLFDMHGNVLQWCSDWLDEHYYEKSPGDDPKGPDTGTSRVMRGGSFYLFPCALRCATRGRHEPSFRSFGTGFRVVREQ